MCHPFYGTEDTQRPAVIASEAKQSSILFKADWIASELTLLAMTAKYDH
jgi:hypothetical protein